MISHYSVILKRLSVILRRGTRTKDLWQTHCPFNEKILRSEVSS